MFARFETEKSGPSQTGWPGPERPLPGGSRAAAVRLRRVPLPDSGSLLRGPASCFASTKREAGRRRLLEPGHGPHLAGQRQQTDSTSLAPGHAGPRWWPPPVGEFHSSSGRQNVNVYLYLGQPANIPVTTWPVTSQHAGEPFVGSTQHIGA
jgi:hypothetical protein